MVKNRSCHSTKYLHFIKKCTFFSGFIVGNVNNLSTKKRTKMMVGSSSKNEAPYDVRKSTNVKTFYKVYTTI